MVLSTVVTRAVSARCCSDRNTDNLKFLRYIQVFPSSFSLFGYLVKSSTEIEKRRTVALSQLRKDIRRIGLHTLKVLVAKVGRFRHMYV